MASVRRVDPEISLAVVCPELAAQWHPTLNAGLRVGPAQVSARSLLWVWWRCPLGHEWEQSIASRSDVRPRWKQQQPTACPYCAGRRSDHPAP
ncbi:MAG TPA: zinc-ribbon domain-containing protein [Pseudonocardia sp.]|nr:zinc-ribbon domain-containing protein [Pseudonocardia sp.]